MNWLQKVSIQLHSPLVDPREKTKWEIIGLVRGHLEGTDRFSTKGVLFHLINDVIPVEMSEFSLISDEMFRRGFLENPGLDVDEFRWAKNSPGFPGKIVL